MGSPLCLVMLDCASLKDCRGNSAFNKVKYIEEKILFLGMKMISQWELASELFHIKPSAK